MRKAFCLILLLAALAAGALVGVGRTVHADRAAVRLAEETLYGDADYAEKLTVRRRATLRGRLYWDIFYVTPAAQDESVTDPAGDITVNYQYYPTRQDYFEYEFGADIGVRMENFLEYGIANIGHGAVQFSDEMTELYGLNRAYKELFDRTAPGEETKKEVRLADYMDYYPLAVTIGMPDNSGWYSMTENEYQENYLMPGVEDDGWSRTFADFRQFFRIPVLEDERVTLSVGKRMDGSLGTMGSGTGNSDSFYLEPISAWTEQQQAIWFTFGTHSAQGKVVDTSLIPGGYGIYKLPYMTLEEMDQKGLSTTADSGRLEMVYAIDPQHYVVTLFFHQPTGNLLLVTLEDGVGWLTAIDPDTMTALQRIEIGPWEPGHNGFVEDCGRFLAVRTSQNRLAVVTVQPDNSYRLEFLTPLPAGEEKETYNYYVSPTDSFDFDGEKLVVGREMHARYYGGNKDFWLMVYTADGLQYVGEYSSSLYAGGSQTNWNYYAEEISLDVAWNHRAEWLQGA